MRHIVIIITLFLLSSQVFPQNTQIPSISQENLGEKQRISLAKQENKIGNKFWKKKDFALAFEHFRLATELNPKISLYYINTGICQKIILYDLTERTIKAKRCNEFNIQ